MRRRGVSSSASVAFAFACALASAPAWADDKQACSDAYDKAQSLRSEGKLGAAHGQALACMRDVCAAFIRSDCTRWLDEIEALSPTVVVEAVDARGRDLRDVRVALDGAPWLAKLDGKALTVDPGAHTLRFEREGAAPFDETVQIREGEKARVVRVTLGGGAGAETSEATGRSPAPWVLGGVGAAGLVLGGILGGVVLSAKSTVVAQCNIGPGSHTSLPPGTCASQDGTSAASTVHTLGPATTVALVAGSALVAGAAVWLVLRRGGSARPAVGLVATPSAGGALRVEGRF